MKALEKNELRQLLHKGPATFSVSMLPCAQKEAVATLRKKVETEGLKVRDTRREYFVAAQVRDQTSLRQIGGTPSKIEALRHRKQVAWRMAQSQDWGQGGAVLHGEVTLLKKLNMPSSW